MEKKLLTVVYTVGFMFLPNFSFSQAIDFATTFSSYPANFFLKSLSEIFISPELKKSISKFVKDGIKLRKFKSNRVKLRLLKHRGTLTPVYNTYN